MLQNKKTTVNYTFTIKQKKMSKKITWHDLPKEIQNRMLDCQEEQGNPRDAKVFEPGLNADVYNQGFNWADTIEGGVFWFEILIEGNLDHFYTIYPKQPKFQPAEEITLPALPYGAELICKKMEVSDDGIRYIPHYILVKKEYPLVAHPYMAIMPNGSTCSFRFAREIDQKRNELEAEIKELEKMIAERQEKVNKLKGK